MENSRHERAVVVVASYVIGFVSAFIAFGVSNTVEPEISQVAVITPEPVAEKVVKVNNASLRVDETGLYVISEGKEQLLTARRSSPLLANVITAEPQSGFAEKLAEAELSRDNKFVYFCEQLVTESEVCDAYVYDIASEILHRVTLAGTNLAPEIDSHQSIWLQDGKLSVNGNVSISSAAPWELQ